MPTFETEITIAVEISYDTDHELRQGDDAKYPSEPFVDDFSWEFVNKDEVSNAILGEAIDHLEEG